LEEAGTGAGRTRPRRSHSRSERIVLGFVLAAGVGLVCLGLAELLARGAGARPFEVVPSGIRVEPGGSLFQPHPTLGYSHRPGRYEVSQGLLRFVVTHGEDSLRITHPAGVHPGRPEIWLFGCSLTHGWGVSDRETYAWLLQGRLPRYQVVNFGVNGYGTLHSLIQFEEALAKRGPPAVAVLAYAHFHDDRNTFARARRKLVVPWNHLGPLSQPRARFRDGELRIDLAPADYRELPLMRHLASVHLLEQALNRLEQRSLRGGDVAEALLDRFAELGRRHGVSLVAAGISDSEVTRSRLEFLRSRGWHVVDIAVDLEQPVFNNLPSDPHPSARAHRVYARRLGDFLATQVLPLRAPLPPRSRRRRGRFRRYEREKAPRQ
jgi:hypothetical protein